MTETSFLMQPDLFKPIQSILAVLILISLGSASPVDGSGVLWFIGVVSLTVSTTSTILLMFNKEGLAGRNVHLANGILPWSVIEFVYSAILTLLAGIGFWISFGYASHVPPMDGHSAGYVFAGIFLIAEMACYAIPALVIYNNLHTSKEHEPIAEVNPFGFNSRIEETRYQTTETV